MIPRIHFAAICAGFLLSPPLFAQRPLAWKVQQGDRFFIEEVTSVRQTIKIMGTETRQDFAQTKLLRYIVLGRNADGNLLLDKRIEAVKVSTEVGDAAPESKIAQLFEGAEFLVTLNPKGRIVKADGLNELLDRLGRKMPEASKLLRALVSEETLTTTDVNLFHFPPENAKDGAWQDSTVVPLGPLGRLEAVHDYRLVREEKKDSIAKIAVTSKLTYALPPENAGHPIKVLRGFLKPEEARGTILFDVARGRIVHSETRRVLDGTLHVRVPGGSVDMDLHQEQTVTLRLLDRSPPE
jgi:hypothetical protein